MAVAQTWNTAELVAQDKAHLLHPLSNLRALRDNGPLVMVRGEDVFLWDSDGKRYIDAFAGLWNVNVGHGRAELADVATAQMREVAFVPNFFGLASPPPIELATRLAELFPGTLNHFQFTSGGAESNETALKIARYYWWLQGRSDKVKILSRKMAYHGIAMGALAATGIPTYHEGFGPNVPGFVHLTPPYQYRHGEDISEDEFVAALVRELEETIAREGADTIAAMIGEPVQGAGGVVVPPQGYWAAIAPVLKEHDILLIFDEVICGFGRTGTMFGMQQYGVTPDIVTFAKGITSGYVPLGGVAISEAIYQTFAERPYPGGLTYSGHPLACAAAVATIEVMEDEGIVEKAARLGEEVVGPQLRDLAARHPWIGEIRGTGAFWAIELVRDRETREPLAPYGASSPEMGAILAACSRRGLLPFANFNRIHVVPPLTISADEARRGIEILDQALTEAAGTA